MTRRGVEMMPVRVMRADGALADAAPVARMPLVVLGLCGVVAPLVFVVLVIVAGRHYPGYSHVTQAISELGGVDAPSPMIQNTNFAVAGLLIAAFTLGLQRALGDAARARLGTALVAAFGAACVAHAFLPCDAGCEFVSVTGSAHNLVGLAGFASVVAGVFVLSGVFGDTVRWSAYRRFSRTSAVVGLASLVLWIALAKIGRITVLNGVLQRAFAGTMLLWIEVVAWRLVTLIAPHRPGGPGA